ncbi:MAG: hypothetical protein KIS64_09440 [Fimbriimonadaceae bacterium]|nr:hypothetical protein [Fimbriimonadaceae bacterium]
MEEIPKAAARSLEISLPEITRRLRTTSATKVALALSDVDDPIMFYLCVWYALSHGKTVEISD